jgi:hypothetical protein
VPADRPRATPRLRRPERFTGFACAAGAGVRGLRDPSQPADADHAWIALVVGATIGVLAIVLSSPDTRGSRSLRLTANWMRLIGGAHRCNRLRREPRQLVPVLGTAILYQFSVVLMYGLIFRARIPIPSPVQLRRRAHAGAAASLA